MTPERWRLVGELFDRALTQTAEHRAAWLASCDAPDEVRREVEALLDAHASSHSFLESTIGAEPQDRPAEPSLRLLPGATVGPYRLVRLLGSGGMGVVFEAEDTRLHRRVALKAVKGPGGADLANEQRLRQEARAAAALVHPNIATIYALEDIDGHAYIASEYLEGETLRRTLQRGRFSRDETLKIASALASALEVAHGRGIVHRDLKPENVLRLPDGQVKILDFGLARFEGGARELVSVSRLTMTGLVAGTPGYMAPEQLLGREVDGRADQFALGALIAEMATGTNPLEAGTLAATIAAVMRIDGLPAQAFAAMAPDLAAVVDRCLRQRPEDRYATTGELAAALDACRRANAPASSRVGAVDPAVHFAHQSAVVDAVTGRRSALWWWRFHQAAAAAVYWGMVVPAWLVHRDVPPRLPWFLACLAATIVAANVRLHLRFLAAVLPHELPIQRARTRGWVALADWAVIVLWAYGGSQLLDAHGGWAVVFFAFSIGTALVVALIEPATTRAAFAPMTEAA